MKNWQIKTKIFSAFIMIVLLILAISLISIRSNGIINETLTIIKINNLDITVAFMDFGKAVDQIEIVLFRASAAGNKNNTEYIDKVEELYINGNKILNQIEKRIQNTNIKEITEIKEIIITLKKDFMEFKDRGIIMAQAYNRSGPVVGNMFMKKAEKSNTKFSENIRSAINTNLKLLDQNFIDIRKESEKSIIISIATVGISILFVIIFGLVISNSISHPITKVMECTKIMAEGDIRARLKVNNKDEKRSKNEVYKLSLNFNRFADALCLILKKIANLSKDNSSVKDSLLNNTEMSVAAVTEISANIDSIQKQIDILDKSIDQSTDATVKIKSNTKTFNESFIKQVEMEEDSNSAVTQMAASIKSVATITSEKKTVINKLNKTAQEGNNKLQSTIKVISDIAQSVEKINEMVTLISSISSQTNLLSMNAAIEAAHAGEVGKGFAVVADEIGKLADSSRNSLETISATIKEVTESINKAVQSGNETEKAFKNLNSGIIDVTHALDEISTSTDELDIGSNMILESISKLQKLSATVKDESEDMINNSETVSNSMASVKEISTLVTSSIKEIQIGINNISDSMVDIEELSDKLGNTITELNTEVTKFKTPE